MQRRTLGVLAVLAAALPFATHAETMDYSYVELGYVDTELDDFDADGDGFALRGSLSVHENVFVFAGYEDVSFDPDGPFTPDVDITSLQVGVGGRYPLTPKIDLVGRFGIVKAELDVGSFDEDEDGFTFGVRARGEVMPRFELEGGLEHIDVDDIADDTALVIQGRYFFLENFAGGVSLSFGDADTFGLEGRMTF